MDLGKLTQLSPATVTAITSDLLDEGLIIGLESDAPRGRMARGRPRSLLTLNPAAASVLAVKISVNTIELLLADYTGKRIATRRMHFNSDAAQSETAFINTLIKIIQAFLHDHPRPPESYLEISIAAQGVVDHTAGTIVWSPAISFRNAKIAAPLSDAFGVQCELSHDTNMIAEALHWRDPERYGGTFAVVFIDYGVGMGLFIDDQLFIGETGAASEIGHANHMPMGNLCRCGRNGCLEAYLGDYAILRRARELPGTTAPDTLEITRETIGELVAAANQGHAPTLVAFDDAGVALGYGVARLIATLDPRRIVLTGAGIQGYPYLRESMERSINAALISDLRREIEIEPLTWEEDLILHGIVAQSMQRFDGEVFSGAATRAKISSLAGASLAGD